MKPFFYNTPSILYLRLNLDYICLCKFLVRKVILKWTDQEYFGLTVNHIPATLWDLVMSLIRNWTGLRLVVP